jgi:outer membrane protein
MRHLKTAGTILAVHIIWCTVPSISSAQETETKASEPNSKEPDSHGRPVIGDPIKEDLPIVTEGRPITLSEALTLADERNLSIAAARVDIEIGRTGFKRAWAALLPTAQGSMTLTHADHADEVSMGGGQDIVIRRQDSLDGAIQASMPVLNAQAWLNVGAGRLGSELAELGVENVRQQLLVTVAQAFFQALTARSLIDVQENLFSSAKRQFIVAQTRHVSGIGARLDVIRARGEIVKIRQDLIAAHRAYDNARDTLGILTGLGGLPSPREGAIMELPQGSEENLVTEAVKKRADLKLSRKAADLSEQQLNTSWMQFLPSLNLSWQLTHDFTTPSAFGSDDRTRWNALLTLTVPIYNHMRYADLDEKRASFQKSRIEAENAAQNAELEVRKALRDYMTALEQLETSKEQAVLSREALFLAETAYESGAGTSLEVTDASRSSRQDEVTLALKKFEIQLALLNVLRAIGEDMKEVGNNR